METMVPGARKLPPFVAHNLLLSRPANFPEDVFQNVCGWMAGVDEKFRNPLVGIAEQQETPRRRTVASGSANLLIICLDGVRNIRMGNKPDVAAIDSHTE